MLIVVVVSGIGVSFVYAHGREILHDRPEKRLAYIRDEYKRFFEQRERPPLETLYAKLVDPEQIADAHDTMRLIASYGRSDRSSAVLLDFLQCELTPEARRFSYSRIEALIYMGLTGGEAATSSLKQIFLSENNTPPPLLKNWIGDQRQPSQLGEAVFSLDTVRGRAAIGLMISGPEGDAFVRNYFFERRKQFEKLNMTSRDDNFLFVLIDSLHTADNVKRLGPYYLLVPQMYGSDVPLTYYSSEYLPRTPEFAAMREHNKPHGFFYVFQSGLNDIFINGG